LAERQTAASYDGIRADHVGRYRFAARTVAGEVLDAACGCGYGTFMLAEAGGRVRGVDRDASAIAYAETHWAHVRAQYVQADVLHCAGWYDWIVCFETLEHVEQDGELLQRFARFSHRLLLSVPNQERLPFNRGQFPFHVRHYTPAELDALLRGAGWVIGRLWSQPSRTAPDILPGAGGYTLIAECLRAGP